MNAPVDDPLLHRKRAATEHCLAFANQRVGAAIPGGARVLDYGCGNGFQVRALLDMGYDAWGVDVHPVWNDPERGGNPTATPPFVAERLRTIDPDDNILPFPDATFDFCFSEQVMEHVFDYETVFSELLRVLKPGAVSLHRFPWLNGLTEGHVNLPFPFLCRSRAYLALCAMLHLRSPGQEALDWRATLANNVQIMSFNNYPSKAYLRRIAAKVGAEVVFLERDDFGFRQGGRLRRVWALARRIGAERALAALCSVLLQRFMVLRRRTV